MGEWGGGGSEGGGVWGGGECSAMSKHSSFLEHISV